MIDIAQLRYVRLGTQDLAAAADFATRILGLQIVDKTDEQISFRSDWRDHTLVYLAGDPAEQAIGFEVHGDDAYHEALRDLETHGIAARLGTADEAGRRKARAFARFATPSGIAIDLVLRPQHSGWRYFPSRDAGVTGLEAVALRARSPADDETLWTSSFNGRVSDWVGDAAYVAFDAAHHRLAIHPSSKSGILAVEYRVESVDQLMQNMYFLQSAQVRIVHGPGRRPTSEQMFLTFVGPDDVLFSFVTEGRQTQSEMPQVPRQFARRVDSFCSWGSETDVPEFR